MENQTGVHGQAFAQEWRPTIWHRLGFRHGGVPYDCALEERLVMEGFAESALTSEVYVRLDWGDRLRLLLTGLLHVHVRTHTDVPVRKATSRSSVGVLAPGWQRGV